MSSRDAFRLHRRSILAGSALLGLGLGTRPLRADESPDTILLGRIATFTPDDRIVEAVALSGNIVIATGTREEVLARRTASTIVRDLGDATVIPGLNDAHAHLEREGLKELRPSLAGIPTIPALLARIAKLAAQIGDGKWIVTMPLGDPPFYQNGFGQLAENRMPTLAELDGVAPRNPVYISAPFGYWGAPPTYGMLNSLGLQLNGIDRTTVPRVSGIEIAKDAAGAPTGILINRTLSPALEFDLLPAVPRFAFDDRISALRRSIALYHACGTTSVYEGHGEAPDSIAVYRRLWERGELTMRSSLVISPTWANLAEAERAMRDWLAAAQGRGIGDPMLRISGIFVQYGGNPQVAAMSRDRLPDTGWSGQVEIATTPADFEAICHLAARYNLRLHTIASDNIGPVLAVLSRVNDRVSLAGRRWVVEHVGPASADDLATIERLGVGVTLIPTTFLYKGGKRFGSLTPEQAALLSPAKQLMDLRVPVAAGTDNVPYNPFFTLWTMVARQEWHSGRVVGPAGRLTNAQAIRLMSAASAWFSFEENVKGQIAPGFYADLAVFAGDPLTAAPDDLRRMSPLATMVAGKTVHGVLPG